MKSRTKLKLFCLWLVVLGLMWTGLGVWAPPVPYIGAGAGFLTSLTAISAICGAALIRKHVAGYIRCACGGYISNVREYETDEQSMGRCTRCGRLARYTKKGVNSDVERP